MIDYPLAAILIAGPLAIDFDYKAATVIALAFGGIAVVQPSQRIGRPAS